MGAELFNFVWVKAIVLFFQYLGWALFNVGLILTVFETAIAYQNGQGDIKSTFLNILKGFIATSLFTTLPVELYKFSVSLQTSLSVGLAGVTNAGQNIGTMASNSLGLIGTLSVSGIFTIFFTDCFGLLRHQSILQ